MLGQMTIFDFLEAPGELDTIPEEDMVEQIGAAIGAAFTYNSFFDEYQAKIGKITLTLEYNNYFEEVDNGARFISCGIGTQHEGTGSPCDSISDAIEFFRTHLRKYEKERKEKARSA